MKAANVGTINDKKTNLGQMDLNNDQSTSTTIVVQTFCYNKAFNSLICGAAAGIAAKTCIAPMERIKMSFQVSSEKFTLAAAFARGKDLVHKQGALSMWRGHSTTILRVAPYAGLSYFFHDYVEHLFKNKLNTNNLPAAYKFLAGSAAGFGGTIFTYPLDVLRVRLALGGTWKSSLKQGGLSQGLIPTLAGIVPYAGTAWLVKQSILERFPNTMNRKPRVYESLLINAVAGLIGQFVTYPLDVVRRRMQVAVSFAGRKPRLRDVISNLVQKEGIRGLGKGFTLNIIKGPISLSISLTVYDLLSEFLRRCGNVQ